MYKNVQSIFIGVIYFWDKVNLVLFGYFLKLIITESQAPDNIRNKLYL